MTLATINIQLVPTPLIAVRRGSGQGQSPGPQEQVGITDENEVILADENNTPLVND